jgi:hypothetical protein
MVLDTLYTVFSAKYDVHVLTQFLATKNITYVPPSMALPKPVSAEVQRSAPTEEPAANAVAEVSTAEKVSLIVAALHHTATLHVSGPGSLGGWGGEGVPLNMLASMIVHGLAGVDGAWWESVIEVCEDFASR